MFRLNGDIVKQLENIYGIKFKQKYKSDLKDRILFFLKFIIKKHEKDDYFETLSKIAIFLEIKDNKPYIIKQLFFNVYKEELFNSFNPIWYERKTVEIIYTKKQLQYIFLDFFISCSNNFDIKYEALDIASYQLKLDNIKFNKLYKPNQIIFSKRLYSDLYNLLIKEIFKLYNLSFFKFSDTDFEELFLKIENFIDYYKNKNIDLYSLETTILFKDILSEFSEDFCIDLSQANFFHQQRVVLDVFRFYYLSKIHRLFKQELDSF